MVNLIRISEQEIDSIHALERGDRCWYWRQYTNGAGYQFSDTNQFIWNIKIKPNDPDPRHIYYRNIAINKFALELADVYGKDNKRRDTFIPIPPSKTKAHPDYNDRIGEILQIVQQRYLPTINIRPAIQQIASRDADHESDERQSIEAIYKNYRFDETYLEPQPRCIIIFDDVITGGRHFKAIQRKLRDHYSPDIPILGLFVARGIRQED